MLSSTQDWQLRVDLRSRLKFPEQIATSSLSLNLIIWSIVSRQVVMLKLTLPWKENLGDAFERKLEKYQELVEKCRSNQCWTTCLEVGCHGFAGRSLCRTISQLGLRGVKKRKPIRAISESEEKASKWLWSKRSNPWSSTSEIRGH